MRYLQAFGLVCSLGVNASFAALPDGKYCMSGVVIEGGTTVTECNRRVNGCGVLVFDVCSSYHNGGFDLVPPRFGPYPFDTVCINKCNGRWVPDASTVVRSYFGTGGNCGIPGQLSSTRTFTVSSDGTLTGNYTYSNTCSNSISSQSVSRRQNYTLSMESRSASHHWQLRSDPVVTQPNCSQGFTDTVRLESASGSPWVYSSGAGQAQCAARPLRVVDPQQFPDLATLGLEALKGRIASPTVEEAVGTSTDKASLAILAFEVAHPTQAVTFSICGDDCTTGPVSDGSRGSLLPMSAFSVSPAPTELDGAPTVSTTPELIGGRSFAFALYKPPDLLPATWAGGSIPGMFSVSAFQSGAPATRSLALVTPPVLLVHGIWSDGDAWAEFAEYLRARLPGRVIPVEYGIHNASSFADPRVQRAFDTQLRAELKHARMAGIVANRVDVVGHSMGGLVARRFADPSSVRYVGPPNYGLGYIRKLITVGSPHLGSSLAPWVHSHAGRLPDSGMTVWYPVTLGEALLAAGMDVDSGGLEALIPGSDDLGGLPDQLPYMTISGVAPSSRLSTRGALELIVRAYDGLSAPLGDSLDSIFGSSNHDTIVEVQSQAYGAGSAVQIADLLHASVGETLGLDEATETNSPAVFRQVTCWLTAGRLCETAVSLVPTSAHAQVTMGSPVPAIWDIDFGALTQRPSAELTVTPNAGVLPQGRPTTISVGSTGRPIARVAILVGTYLGDRTAAPYSWPVTPNHAGSLAVTVVALFQDNSYARTTLTYQVQPVAALVSLRAEPSTIVLPSLDDSARIVLHGSYANGVTIRIEEGAAFALGSGAGVAQVSSSGEVTALAPGEASASVSYSGKSILVPIRVFGSGDIIFRNGFEGIGPAVALTRSLVQP